jgi:CheY-like chemotaxis protein
MTKKAVKILLVDDDEVDVIGITKTLKSLKITNDLRHAFDGVDALEHLRGTNGKTKLEPPYLILLDLNMPRMGGLEFLDEIRKDPKLRKAIIFVMTTSADEKDVYAAYDKNIAGYVVKSNAEHTFKEALSMLDLYWTIVELP